MWAGYNERAADGTKMGVVGAINSLNPLYAIIRGGAETYLAIAKGDYEAAGEKGVVTAIITAVTVVGVIQGLSSLGGRPPAGSGAASEAAEAGAANAARAELVGALRARVLERAGFSGRGTPIVVDNSIGANPTKVAEALRSKGVNARSVIEIFGKDPGDAAIRNLAETVGGRVLAADRGRDLGGGFGRLAIKTRQGLDVGDFARLIQEALK